MGFRFRKSVKIAPGVKLNLSKSGSSLSVGGRGATTNISSRGIRSTCTVPGTGISYVTQASTGEEKQRISSSQAGNRSVQKDLLHQQKKEEKQRALQEAKEKYLAFQGKVESLSSILRDREKQPFNWEEFTSPRGEYKHKTYAPGEFVEPEPSFSKAALRQEIRSRKQAKFYITYFLTGLSFILIFYSFGFFLFLLTLAGIGYAFEQGRFDRLCDKCLLERLQEEAEKFNQHRENEHQQYLKKIEAEKSEHVNSEREREKIWNQEEQCRKRLRNSVSSDDAEPLAELLRVELSNEILPVPLVFDIRFIDGSTVILSMKMPDLDVVPKQRLRLTKTGKLSEREMSQKDRYQIYSNVCTGLALRLIYETFRVIYSVSGVELRGLTEKNDPVNGHSEEITSLRLQVLRHDFEKLQLDSLEPQFAIKSLDGDFACSKKCELMPLSIV